MTEVRASVRDSGGDPVRRGPGRPPDVNGEDTKEEIRRIARHLFATHGYAGTTTRMVAEGVGVTPAALHHYFGRKKNLALSLWRSTTDAEFARLRAAMDAEHTFVGKSQALIEASLRSLRTDRESSIFITAIREEARRTPDLGEIVEDTRLAALIRDLVNFGVEAGAVDADNASAARGAIGAILVGANMMAIDVGPHRREQMARGCKALLAGTLFDAPSE